MVFKEGFEVIIVTYLSSITSYHFPLDFFTSVILVFLQFPRCVKISLKVLKYFTGILSKKFETMVLFFWLNIYLFYFIIF